MPNVGTVLKEEIARLSKKEVRRQLAAIKKASAQYRRHIAALRRQIGSLVRQLSALGKQRLDRMTATATTADEKAATRFAAKGLRSHRIRLGLSAEEYGRLVGVSAQTVYSWEQKKSNPRAAQQASLAAVRGLGKREARARLEAVTPRGGKRPRRARR